MLFKKRFLILILSLLSLNESLCQISVGKSNPQQRLNFSWGVSYQYNITNIHPNWDGSNTQARNHWGAGIWFEKRKLDKMVSSQLELHYEKRGFFESLFEEEYTFHYISFVFSPKINISNFFASPSIFYSRIIDKSADNNPFSFKLEKFKQNDFGIGIGFGAHIFKRIQLEVSFSQGIVSIFDDKHSSTSGALTGDKTPYRTRSFAFTTRLNFGM